MSNLYGYKQETMTKADLMKGKHNALAADLTNQLGENQNLTPSLTDALASGLESRSVLASAGGNIEQVGRATFGSEWDSLTKAQKEAFRITGMAWADMKGYDAIATTVNAGTESRLVALPGIESRLDGLGFSNEAYDARQLLNAKVASSIVNVGSARQDDFGEMFYETVVLPPDEGNVRISIENTFIMTDYLHTGTGLGGVPQGFGSISLVEAIINPEVLRDNSIKVVPIYQKTNPIFINEVNSWKDGSIDTGALKFNTAIDLLAASIDAVINPTQVADSTDQLDHDVRIDTVFLKVVNKADKTSIIPIELKNIPGANFVASPLSKTASRDMILNFSTTTMPIHGKLTDIAGVEAEALEYLRDPTRKDWVVYLDMNLSGQVNLETASIRVNDSKVQIASTWNQVVQDNGMCKPIQVVEPTDTNQLAAEFKSLELIGWYPHASRTNFNRRTRGLLVRGDVFSESYTIPMGPPISVLTPVVDTETLVDLEAPIKTNRIRNSHNAVKTLIEYGNMLKRYHNVNDVYSPRPDVYGAGRYLVRPYYEEISIHLPDIVNSLRSTERLEDLNFAIITIIRSVTTKAWSNSLLGPTYQAMGIEGKPVVNIGTNYELGTYIDLKADNRLLGDMFDCRMATTFNREIGNTIYINFSTTSDHVPLKSGNFYYIPEIVSTLPKTTNGGQSVQLTVQNRNMHLNHLPIQIRINVTGLDEVLEKALPVYTEVVKMPKLEVAQP